MLITLQGRQFYSCDDSVNECQALK